ncbi:hypothetical protein STCU_11141 [Strigomonas culicis]|uniref:Uncharacterized protein n=1 Tax=Strigomonas culicis TaxID=28005 RepID=S9TET9_9TRYP|nr:hypothetical protein STCU_11141 [Strigomonas culicis]|eukprot:EPY16557.1 hypothetical protein STCU_11141 [Strigomonas culicis]
MDESYLRFFYFLTSEYPSVTPVVVPFSFYVVIFLSVHSFSPFSPHDFPLSEDVSLFTIVLVFFFCSAFSLRMLKH